MKRTNVHESLQGNKKSCTPIVGIICGSEATLYVKVLTPITTVRNESAYTSRAGGYADVMWTVQKGHQRIKRNKWSTVQHVESNKAWLRFKSGCVRVVARRLFGFMMNERGPTISQFHHNSVLTVKCQPVKTLISIFSWLKKNCLLFWL